MKEEDRLITFIVDCFSSKKKPTEKNERHRDRMKDKMVEIIDPHDCWPDWHANILLCRYLVLIQPEERLHYLIKLDMHAEAADLAFQLKNLEVGLGKIKNNIVDSRVLKDCWILWEKMHTYTHKYVYTNTCHPC